MRTAAFYTLGCKVNQYETESLKEIFAEKGYEILNFDDVCDVYIVNSCTVTAMSDKKSRQALSRAKRKNPDAITALIGCYAQHLTDEEKKQIGADIVLGTGDKSKLLELVEDEKAKKGIDAVSDIKTHTQFDETPVTGAGEDRMRGYIKIEDGCNRYCSYCIIPYVRGPVRSRPLENIRKEAEALAESGIYEVVLTGIQTGAYGSDFKDENISLIDAIEAAASAKGVKRIRLSSLEPNTITEEFLARCRALDAFCAHFHLSLQSGCDKILKAMNRRYTTQEYFEKTELIREFFPNAAITTDIIAGFPGETEEDFIETVEFAKKCRLAKIHAFPYSPREGTKAATLPNLPEKSIRNQRTQSLIMLSEHLRADFLKTQYGTKHDVYFEKQESDEVYSGYTDNYIYVHKAMKRSLLGKIHPVILSPNNIAQNEPEAD